MQADKTVRLTALAHAFVEAACKPVVKANALKARLERIERRNPKAGLVTERAVNANLSFRTAQKLKQEGVL